MEVTLQFPLADSRFNLAKRSRRQLPFPATPKLRMAQISATGRRLFGATVFTTNAWGRVAAFRPQVLIGSIADIQRLSERAKVLGIDLKTIDHAIIVLTSFEDEPLSDVARVVLWQTFGVPVYESIVTPPGLILAAECVAHEGWHLEPGTSAKIRREEIIIETSDGHAATVAFAAQIVSFPCPCGRPGLRLMSVAAQESLDDRQLAAIA